MTHRRHTRFVARKTITRLMAVCFLWMVATGQSRVHAQADTTQGEIAMLPAYCVDTMGFGYGDAYTNTSPKAAYWIGLMGKSFWAMHHHCFGLLKLRRGSSGLIPAPVRQGYLQSAIGEFEYVLRNSKPGFIMLPEVNLQLGNTHVLLKNYGAAQIAFDRAIKQKADFAPPYARWAEVLEQAGNKKSALAFLESGLRHAPTSTELLAQYKRLGGNADAFVKSLPPPPVATTAAPNAPAATGVNTSNTPAASGAAPAPQGVGVPQAPAADVAAPAASR